MNQVYVVMESVIEAVVVLSSVWPRFERLCVVADGIDTRVV